MSFTTVLDRVRVVIPTLTGFTSKFELPNPVEVESNPIGFLKAGWGVIIGDSTNGDSEFNTLVENTGFSVVLTTELAATDNNADAYYTAVKLLKTEALALQKAMLNENVLAIPDDLENSTYESMTAIELGNSDQYKFLTVTVNFIFSVRELL